MHINEVINMYMNVLNKFNTTTQSHVPVCHFFSSFFYKQLTADGYTYRNVRRWTRKFDIFRKDIVFVPINVSDSHWVLATIDFHAKASLAVGAGCCLPNSPGPL